MKVISHLPILLIALFILSACTPVLKLTPLKVNNFEECVNAGNPVMESYPRQCRHGEKSFTEEIKFDAGSEGSCTSIFRPVCGKLQVQCIKAPCPPIATTFQNRCEADVAGATDVVEGACEDEAPNPEGACLSFDGNWLPESRECEGMSREQCEAIGGTFNECASACRNDPTAEICTMQCVIVCQF